MARLMRTNYNAISCVVYHSRMPTAFDTWFFSELDRMERDEAREAAIDEVLRRWFRDAIDGKPRDVTAGQRPDIDTVMSAIAPDGDCWDQMQRLVKATSKSSPTTVGIVMMEIIEAATNAFMNDQKWRDRAARTMTGDDYE